MRDFCSSNVLWFINEHVDHSGTVYMTVKAIANEFGVDEECLRAQIDLLCSVGFIRQISQDEYEITELGKEECKFLLQFVQRGKVRQVNPRTAVKTAAMLHQWFPNKSADEITYEFAKMMADLRGRKFKCTEKEFEMARRLMS